MIKWVDQSPKLELPSLDSWLSETAGASLLVITKPTLLVRSAVREQVLAHLRQSDLEQGGLLLGRAFCSPHHPVAMVIVETAVAARESAATAISLRMQSTVWSEARELMQPGQRIVGWYHSHPGIGAFFSQTDRDTQAAFFRNTYSVGWVLDPLARGLPHSQCAFLGADATEIPILELAAP